MEIKIFCNLNPKYKHGNQVLDTEGICICLTEAMGAGGGAYPFNSDRKWARGTQAARTWKPCCKIGGQMKPYSVIDTYNQAVYDICPTLKTTYDKNNSIFVVAPWKSLSIKERRLDPTSRLMFINPRVFRTVVLGGGMPDLTSRQAWFSSHNRRWRNVK